VAERTPTSDPTPTAWRVAALAVLVGGVAAGLAAGRGARRFIGLSAAVAAAYVIPLAIAGRKPPIPPDADPLDPSLPPPTFSILVAARDEAAVVPNLVRDVAAQDHRAADGTAWFELIVVDDRSVDGTGNAAKTAAESSGIGPITRIVRRDGAGLIDGKGAALTAVQPEACTGEVVVVLDADARIGPDFLRRLAAYVRAGAGAITARRRILDADSWLTGAQADEQTLDGELQRGRWALGGCSEFRGNGIVVRRDLLAAVGGWRAEALTEDLDLSSRLAAYRGITVAWALDVVVGEEPVRSVGALWRQRLRWAEGGIRRVLEHGPAVIASPLLGPRARIDFVVYAGQLVVPPAILGSLAGAAIRGRPGPAAALLGTYLAAGGVLAYDALRWETGLDGGPLPPRERARRALRVGLFSGIWLGAIPAAMWRLATRRGTVGYEKMAHVGGGPGEWSG